MTLPRGHSPKVSDQAKRGLIREATKQTLSMMLPPLSSTVGMALGDEQQQQDIIYTYDNTYSMCFLLPLATGCLITMSQYSSSPPLSFTAV